MLYERVKITEDLIKSKIDSFNERNGVAEDVLKRLFKKADNRDFDDVFCRVGLIDLLYSTRIQSFGKGGISTVATHIVNNADDIEESLLKGDIDYELYEKLVNIDYSICKNLQGKESRVYSFMSKFLSFSQPEVYPIMDGKVKKLIGIDETTGYKAYCDKIFEIKNHLCQIVPGITLKETDMFLWQWAKDEENRKRLCGH